MKQDFLLLFQYIDELPRFQNIAALLKLRKLLPDCKNLGPQKSDQNMSSCLSMKLNKLNRIYPEIDYHFNINRSCVQAKVAADEFCSEVLKDVQEALNIAVCRVPAKLAALFRQYISVVSSDTGSFEQILDQIGTDSLAYQLRSVISECSIEVTLSNLANCHLL
mmetsp:Transcript_31172/g.54175  ORF Transcript_31172/g.54175 Transcript_31172/m.54175 type:complete len:164 (-) Transcript_31172:216-707(-)